MQTLCQCDVSVIIPVYNLEDYITPMIESLKRQDLGDYKAEYIFVLNNCSDRSEEVIRKSGIECQIYECEKQGCGCARNVGFDHSKGKYIWFMDGDDWLLSDTAIKDVLLIAYGYDLALLRVPFESERFAYDYFSMVWQYLMRRDLIEEFRFRQQQPAEDDEFMAKVLYKAGYSPATYMQLPHIKKAQYYYNYLREGSNMYRYYLGEQI